MSPHPDMSRRHDTCPHRYTRAAFHLAARRALRDVAYTRHERKTLRRIVRCATSARSRRLERWHLARYKRAFRRREALRALTPYPGPNGTRWAIPWGIIACESHGSWSAYNRSGARGPYQLLGWKVPWPVRSAADRLAHHRMAARVWAGGRGRANWVC